MKPAELNATLPDTYRGRMVEHLRPGFLRPPHAVYDPAKLRRIQKSMQTHGWKGRPLVVVSVGTWHQALTGSHRSAAAASLGMLIPAIVVDVPGFDVYWSDYGEACEALAEHDLLAARVMESDL